MLLQRAKPSPGVGIPRRQIPAHNEEGCSYRADQQQNRPPLRKGAKVLVQEDAVRSVVLDIFRIRELLCKSDENYGSFFFPDKLTDPSTHVHVS